MDLSPAADSTVSPSASPGASGLQLHLSTLLALLTALPARVQRCPALLEQTWRHLTPALVRLLGSPTTERVSSHPGTAEQPELGRGSGGLDQQPSLPPADARIIFR